MFRSDLWWSRQVTTKRSMRVALPRTKSTRSKRTSNLFRSQLFFYIAGSGIMLCTLWASGENGRPERRRSYPSPKRGPPKRLSVHGVRVH